jgi:UDP-N-acetylmuramoyl-tripeptide--D-alanyl-D-alanine ligase
MASVAGLLVILVTLANGKTLISGTSKEIASVLLQTNKAVAFKGLDFDSGAADREALASEKLPETKCKAAVNQDDLKVGIDLGVKFLVRSQREAGNFRYEYNWLTQAEADEDNPVRQAGTLWGLSLLHVDDPKRNLLPTLQKGLKYFEKHSSDFENGERLLIYPGQDPQKLGSVALLALSHIEVLRHPDLLSSEEKATYEAHLEGFLKALLAARTGKSNFYKYYDSKTGKHFGNSSPYYDGECLLALVKAAKYLGHSHLWSDIKESAEAGWRKNVKEGLQLAERSSDEVNGKKLKDANSRLKGYYQWSSMAWYELLGMEDPDFQKYAPRMLKYGTWLLQKGATSVLQGGSSVNMGYAFEGIIPAYITAMQEGNTELAQKFACAVQEGISNLHTLQVGHPKEYKLVESGIKSDVDAQKKFDERAKGGAQGNRDSAALRIDTTQHHLHALLMASRLLSKQQLI